MKKRIISAIAIAAAAGAMLSNHVSAYDNITAEVLQIQDFINNGLYIEAMQNCEQTKAWHNLSYSDISILDNYYNQAYNAYQSYLKRSDMSKYNGEWYYTPSGDNRPLVVLSISNANSTNFYAHAERYHGKPVQYNIGTAWFVNDNTAEANGTEELAIYNYCEPRHYTFTMLDNCIKMNDMYFFR